MFKNFFPNKILSLGDNFFWILIVLFILVILIGLTYALFISPPDYIQGDAVRIMYVHVPSAWIGLASFSLIALFSILNFIFETLIHHRNIFYYWIYDSKSKVLSWQNAPFFRGLAVTYLNVGVYSHSLQSKMIDFKGFWTTNPPQNFPPAAGWHF